MTGPGQLAVSGETNDGQSSLDWPRVHRSPSLSLSPEILLSCSPLGTWQEALNTSVVASCNLITH